MRKNKRQKNPALKDTIKEFKKRAQKGDKEAEFIQNELQEELDDWERFRDKVYY